MRVSALIIQNPEIRELDINPLLVDDSGAIAIDARIAVAGALSKPRAPLAIRPYPAEWETAIEAAGHSARLICVLSGPMTRRCINAFFDKISKDDVRMRFFTPQIALSHHYLARLTQIDYAREMAFVAIAACRPANCSASCA